MDLEALSCEDLLLLVLSTWAHWWKLEAAAKTTPVFTSTSSDSGGGVVDSNTSGAHFTGPLTKFVSSASAFLLEDTFDVVFCLQVLLPTQLIELARPPPAPNWPLPTQIIASATLFLRRGSVLVSVYILIMQFTGSCWEHNLWGSPARWLCGLLFENNLCFWNWVYWNYPTLQPLSFWNLLLYEYRIHLALVSVTFLGLSLVLDSGSV
jgi:hypothetical protein